MPLVALLLLAGVGYAISRGNGGVTTRRDTAPSSSSELDPSKGDAIDQLIARADDFSRSTDAHAAPPSSPDYAKLAAEAKAAREKAEADQRAAINKKFDEVAGAASAVALATDVGVVAIPFVLAAAQAGKWAASAQITLLKSMIGGADGWSDDWQNNLKGEIAWLTEHGVPFHPWNAAAHISPMGYVNGGGGETCGLDGLCGLREGFQALPPNLNDLASKAFASMKAHVTDNPFVTATYAAVSRGWVAWTLGAGTGAEMPIVEQAAREDFYTKDHATDVRRFYECLVAAIATTTAQDMGVPFERWREVIAHTWVGWDTGIVAARKAGVQQTGAWGVAFARDFAQWKCKQILGGMVAARKGGTVVDLRLIRFAPVEATADSAPLPSAVRRDA